MEKNSITKTAMPLFLAAGLTACGGGSSGGGKETPSVLSQSEARDVIAQNLDNSQKGVDARVGFSPVENITFDVIGEYGQNQRSVGVVYDRDLENTGVPSQGGVDYVLNIPKGNRGDIQSAMNNDLDASVFGPVVEESKDLGDYNVADRVNGGLNVRSSTPSSLTANCEVYDSNGDKLVDFDLQYDSGAHKIPTNSGFGLGADEYTANCSFENSNGVKTTLEDAFAWQVVNSEAPEISGVSIDNESDLMKYDGKIRDVNDSVSVSYDSVSDDNDTNLDVVGYVTADGETNTYQVNDKSFSFNPNQLGGLEAEIGIRATDSQGAVGKENLTRMIHNNSAPTCNVPQNLEFESKPGENYLMKKEDCNDVEGDNFSLSGNLINMSDYNTIGTYSKDVSVSDEFETTNTYNVEFETVCREGTEPNGAGGCS